MPDITIDSTRRKRFVLCGKNEYNRSSNYFCFDFDVTYNSHGNIEVKIDKTCSSFVPFFRSNTYVFDRSGVCISHPPSKKYRLHKVNAMLVDSHT
jgi:hypothetical protein